LTCQRHIGKSDKPITDKIRIVLIEKDENIRSSLVLFLDENNRCCCVASFSNPEEAMQQIPLLQPDVVLSLSGQFFFFLGRIQKLFLMIV
jgi:hypothetical protein